MNHNERMKIARKITRMLVNKYGNNLLVCGIYGSVARGEDEEYSDLEMILITRKKIQEKYFSFKDITVLITTRTKEEALKEIKDMWIMWPLNVGKYLDIKILHGSKVIIEELKNKFNSLSDEKFKEGAENALTNMLESLGKLKNGFLNKNKYVVFDAAKDFSLQLSCFVALLNKKYYKRSGFMAFEESKGFRKIPKYYFSLIKKIWLSRDYKKVYDSCLELWKNSLKLAEKSGIKMRVYESVEEIKL